MNVIAEQTIQTLRQRFSADKARNLRATYLITIHGENGGAWLTKIGDGKCEFIPHQPCNDGREILADCRISVAAADFELIMNGQLPAMQAALSGVLSIEGEFGLALKLMSIFFDKSVMNSTKPGLETQIDQASITFVHPEIHNWLEATISSSGIPLNVRIRFWGKEEVSSTGNCDTQCRSLIIDVHHPGVIRQLVIVGDPLILVEAIVVGQVTYSGSIDDLVSLYCYLVAKQCKPSESLWQWCKQLPESSLLPPGTAAWSTLAEGSPQRDKAVVQYHYDVSNDFYKLWLDPLMVYSCAHFDHPEMTLADAQKSKLDLICRKLRLQPGQTFLDIGCGWGALLHWAVTHYGVSGHGITLSEEQLAHNRKWIADQGLNDKVTVALMDYRDLPPQPAYDKIASIGMIEHVGIANYATYFQNALAVLKPGGLFLNHGISVNYPWDAEVAFIWRYIFPDALCPPVATYLQSAADAGWEIVDVDSWRPHYAKTLRCWAANLNSRLDQATAIMGDRVKIWQLYLIVCAQGFENGAQGVYQMLLRRAADSQWNLPLTRQHWLC